MKFAVGKRHHLKVGENYPNLRLVRSTAFNVVTEIAKAEKISKLCYMGSHLHEPPTNRLTVSEV